MSMSSIFIKDTISRNASGLSRMHLKGYDEFYYDNVAGKNN